MEYQIQCYISSYFAFQEMQFFLYFYILEGLNMNKYMFFKWDLKN